MLKQTLPGCYLNCVRDKVSRSVVFEHHEIHKTVSMPNRGLPYRPQLRYSLLVSGGDVMRQAGLLLVLYLILSGCGSQYFDKRYGLAAELDAADVERASFNKERILTALAND